MKLNKNILSIPPYISTAWENIASLSLSDKGTLLVALMNGSSIEIPHLSGKEIEEVFAMHASVVEKDHEKKSGVEFSFGLPMNMEGMNGPFGSMMEHDQAQANSPPLPQEMLEKIASITNAMGIGDVIDQMPDAQPHCNCPFCQVSRSLHNKQPAIIDRENDGETISDDELTFRDWSVEELEKNLFKVTSPLDPNESYQVFLGTPVGCTCGENNCEHIKIVLNS